MTMMVVEVKFPSGGKRFLLPFYFGEKLTDFIRVVLYWRPLKLSASCFQEDFVQMLRSKPPFTCCSYV